jgi:hypothetical protein
LGAHVPDKVQVPVQAASGLTVQLPSAAAQQEPCGGCGQGLVGSQVSQASCHSLGEVQTACVVAVHAPAGPQQAPVGGSGQGFGEQASQSSCHIAGEVQPGCVVTVQVPTASKTQQAPVEGCGHGLLSGWQIAPECQMPGVLGSAQATWVLRVQ